MPKTNITTFTIAGQLKSGMNAAGNYPVPGDMNAIYTAQNAIWVVLGTTTGGTPAAPPKKTTSKK